MVLYAVRSGVLVPGQIPCLVRQGAVVDLVPSSWVRPPSASVMGILVACSSVVVDASVVLSAFQRLCWLHLSIGVWLFVLSPFWMML